MRLGGTLPVRQNTVAKFARYDQEMEVAVATRLPLECKYQVVKHWRVPDHSLPKSPLRDVLLCIKTPWSDVNKATTYYLQQRVPHTNKWRWVDAGSTTEPHIPCSLEQMPPCSKPELLHQHVRTASVHGNFRVRAVCPIVLASTQLVVQILPSVQILPHSQPTKFVNGKPQPNKTKYAKLRPVQNHTSEVAFSTKKQAIAWLKRRLAKPATGGPKVYGLVRVVKAGDATVTVGVKVEKAKRSTRKSRKKVKVV
jgi:hypothetical protein